MASDRDRVLERLQALIDKGDEVRNTGSQGLVTAGQFLGWRAQAVSTLERTLGPNDSYCRSFGAAVRQATRSQTEAGVAILQALREDVEGGYLARFTDLVAAAMFTDFLTMAEHLHAQGYKDPSASLTGAVLEDGLRKIATNAGIPLKTSDMLDALNKKCSEAGLYNPLRRSHVDGWRILRNDADHGHFDRYTAQDVAMMIAGVRAFLAEHLG